MKVKRRLVEYLGGQLKGDIERTKPYSKEERRRKKEEGRRKEEGEWGRFLGEKNQKK